MVYKKSTMDTRILQSHLFESEPEIRSRSHSTGTTIPRRKHRESRTCTPASSNSSKQKTHVTSHLPNRPSSRGSPKRSSPCGSPTVSPVAQRQIPNMNNPGGPLSPRRGMINTSESIYPMKSTGSVAHCPRCAKHDRIRESKLCHNCEGELIFDYKKLEIRRRNVPKVAFGKSVKEPEKTSSHERLPVIVTLENPESTKKNEAISTDNYITSCLQAASTTAVYRQSVPEGSSLFDSLRDELLTERRDSIETTPESTRNRSNSMPQGFRWSGFQVVSSETNIV